MLDRCPRPAGAGQSDNAVRLYNLPCLIPGPRRHAAIVIVRLDSGRGQIAEDRFDAGVGVAEPAVEVGAGREVARGATTRRVSRHRTRWLRFEGGFEPDPMAEVVGVAANAKRVPRMAS
jgi:hypothetical protein